MELNLKDKGSIVEGLWHAVDHAAGNLANVPGSVRRVLETEAWRLREYRGKRYEHRTFLDFITAKPPAGCGWPPAKVEVLIKDEPEVLAMWREATTGKPHVHADRCNTTLKAVRGTKAHTLSRLKRERPDLFKRVVAGKLSANAAAIEAGWRKRPTTLEKILKLLPKLTPTERRQLRARIDEAMKVRAA